MTMPDQQLYENAFHTAARRRRQMQHMLSNVGLRAELDEMSIVFHTLEEAILFKAWADENAQLLQHYTNDAQVFYVLGDQDVKTYAYHAQFWFYRVKEGDEEWRIQVQAQHLVNPPRQYLHPIFEAAKPGEVVHASYKTDDLDRSVAQIGRAFPLLARMESNHGISAYCGAHLGAFPYLHPRTPKK